MKRPVERCDICSNTVAQSATVWKVLVVRVKMNFNVGIGSCLCNACFSLLDCVCFMFV